jgi:GT2 family glycosyltransferase
MTVHVLMPVFNHLALTQSMLTCLRAQESTESLSIVVVDDGSTDGTGDFLRAQADVLVLEGDGSLWWGGAIDLAMRHVLTNAEAEDWILFVNNDTHIHPGFVQELLTLARRHAPAAVGSAIQDLEEPHALLSLGPRIDPWYFQVSDALDNAPRSPGSDAEVIALDALSGRGVLFPVAALRKVGGMRPRWLPHYLADYELAIRVRRAGWRLLVSPAVSVQSRAEYGNAYRGATWRDRHFAVRSPHYLPAQMRFWWVASDPWQKITMPWRILVFALFPNLRKKA